MSIRGSALVGVALLVAALGCNDQGPEQQIAGIARIVRGPSVSNPVGGATSGAAVAPPLANGIWGITPNQAKATVSAIAFQSSDGTLMPAQLVGTCTVTYARGGQSLTELLQCPFTLKAGTYVGLNISVKNQFEVLIDDPINGVYTDPTSPSKLSTTRPATPQFVPLTVPVPDLNRGAIGSTTIFSQPIVVDSTNPPSVTVVADMIHTVALKVTNGVPNFDTLQIIPVIDMVGSIDGVGKVEYYNTYGTAQNVHMPNVTGIGNQRVRVFYAASGQPSELISPMDSSPSFAYNTSPAANSSASNGWRPGGYLGLDATNTLCWALPKDQAYSEYKYLLRMSVPANVGGTTTLSIQSTPTVPVPVSGNTYASGCPTVNATSTRNLTLVGR